MRCCRRKPAATQVNATISLRFGTLESLKGKAVIADLAGSMLDKGTRNLTRQQIKDKLDALKARVGVGGGASSATASIVTDREHFNEVLKLVREILREPAFPATSSRS
jgi:zinc protease